MAWLDGFVSSGFSGATGTTGGSERNRYHVDSQQEGRKMQAHANFSRRNPDHMLPDPSLIKSTDKQKQKTQPPALPVFSRLPQWRAATGASAPSSSLRFVPQLACSHARSSYRRLQLSAAYKNKQRTGIALCLAGILLSLLLQLLPKLKLYFIDIPIFTYCTTQP